MEAVEEVAPPPSPPKDLSPAAIAKGKRTKRLRSPYSPIPFTVAPQPIAATDFNHDPASSEESTTTEEVDTARCLLLLSRGGHYNTTINAAKAAAGGGTYTCKTCNRVFPSFQALGGHRASHKKPKNEKKFALYSDEEDYPSPPSLTSSKHRISPHSLTLQLSNVSTTTFSAATPKSSPPRPRIHECSYCGAEFTSGQALGGHMRKHRGGGGIISRSVSTPVESLNITAEPSIEELELRRSKKARTELSLDLNLPAPEDEKNTQDKKEAAAELGLSTTTNPPPLVDYRY